MKGQPHLPPRNLPRRGTPSPPWLLFPPGRTTAQRASKDKIGAKRFRQHDLMRSETEILHCTHSRNRLPSGECSQSSDNAISFGGCHVPVKTARSIRQKIRCTFGRRSRCPGDSLYLCRTEKSAKGIDMPSTGLAFRGCPLPQARANNNREPTSVVGDRDLWEARRKPSTPRVMHVPNREGKARSFWLERNPEENFVRVRGMQW